MRSLLLRGLTLFESANGKLRALGPLDLKEGERSERITILEDFDATTCRFRVAAPTDRSLLREGVTPEPPPGVLMVMRGVLQAADKQNKNKRMYPLSLWKRLVPESSSSLMLDYIRSGEMLGEIDHPDETETKLRRVECRTVDVWMEGNDVHGIIYVLDTPEGRRLKTIHEAGGRFGVSSRGTGTLVCMGGVHIVQDDFDMKAWDIVHNPSTHNAYPDCSVVTLGESTKTQETVSMASITETATARLARLAALVKGGRVSGDVRTFVRTEAESIRESLASTTESPAQVGRVVAEATMLIERLSETSTAVNAGDPGLGMKVLGGDAAKEQDEESPKVAEDVARFAKEIGARFNLPAGAATAFARYSLISPQAGWSTVKESRRPDVTIPRAGSEAETVQILRALPGLLENAQQVDKDTFQREAWRRYRESARVDGALSPIEVAGIRKFVEAHHGRPPLVESVMVSIEASTPSAAKAASSVLESAVEAPVAVLEQERNDSRLYTLNATIPVSRLSGVLDDIRRSGVAIARVDNASRAHRVYEAATHFAPLIERAIEKGTKAMTEAAQHRNALTEVSAQLAAAKQLVRELNTKTKKVGAELKERKRTFTKRVKTARKMLEASYRLIEELTREVTAEGERRAIAAVQHIVKDVPNAPRTFGSVREAVATGHKLMRKAMAPPRPFVRDAEAVSRLHTEALNASAKVRDQAAERARAKIQAVNQRAEPLAESAGSGPTKETLRLSQALATRVS